MDGKERVGGMIMPIHPYTRFVAPAKAGAHHASQRKPTDEIGTRLRWCDGVITGAVA
jgi:hypothetical protein